MLVRWYMLTIPTALAARAAEARRLARRWYATLAAWLDATAFPAIVRYATSRPHIVALLLLGSVLMLWHDPSVELVGGNYTNIVSALVSCIVLLQQVSHHHEVKRLHSEHAKQIAALHETVKALATAQGAPQSASATPVKPPRPRTPAKPPTSL